VTGPAPETRDAAAPPWWPVSTAKFVVMNLGTLGFYQFYWLYYNWQRLRDVRGEKVDPVWRTIFAPVTAYRLFERVAESAAEHRVKTRWNPVGLAAVYFVASIVMFVGVPAWLSGPVLLLPVLPVQITMTRVNAVAAPDAPRNGKLTLWNMLMLVGGALLTAAAYTSDHFVTQLLDQWEP
jgi:hypothetical protein